MPGHLEDFTRTPSGSAKKGPYKIMQDRISLGSPQDPFTGTCTRSCKDLLDDFNKIFTRSSHKDLYKTMQAVHQDIHKIF